MFIQPLLLVAAVLASVEAKIYQQCTRDGMFALTFDEGPGPSTRKLLQVLDEKDVKVTFHFSMQNIMDPNVQSLIATCAKKGHMIGLRTSVDPNMDPQAAKAFIARQANVLGNFIGYTPKFLRLPYGKSSDKVAALCEQMGMVVTSFNIETYDYNKSGSQVLGAIKLALSLKGRGSGSFISVQRDAVQSSVAVTGDMISAIKAAGYKIVTLDQCLGLGDVTKNTKKYEGGDGDAGDMAGLDEDFGADGADAGLGDNDEYSPKGKLGGQDSGVAAVSASFAALFGCTMAAALFF